MVLGCASYRRPRWRQEIMGTADRPGQAHRYHRSRDDTAENRCERVQMRRGVVRVGVTEIRVGGQRGGGEGGGAKKTQQQRDRACSQSLPQPPAHQPPGTVTARSSVTSPPSGSVTSASSNQSPAMLKLNPSAT